MRGAAGAAPGHRHRSHHFVPYRYENEQVEAVAKEIIPRLRKKMA
jgi:hypothetical protein